MAIKSVKYNPEIILQFANKLYQEADSIIFRSVIAWSLGGVLPAIITYYFANRSRIASLLLILVIPMVLIGYRLGKEKGTELRLKAQMALCQVEIEKNSRGRANIKSDSNQRLEPRIDIHNMNVD